MLCHFLEWRGSKETYSRTAAASLCSGLVWVQQSVRRLLLMAALPAVQRP